MDPLWVYIAISILALAVITFLVFVVQKRERAGRLSPVSGLALGFFLAGLLFGEERWIGYGLMGIGLVLAVIDILVTFRRESHGI